MSDREAVLGAVSATLAGVLNPRTGQDVLSGGQVQGLEIDEEGKVHFQFLLQAQDAGTLVRAVRGAVEGVPGVARVKIDVKLPKEAQAPAQQPPRRPAPHSVPAPTPSGQVPGIAHIFAVSSGKGGVGKSTVAVNIAAALARAGHRVGLLDADIYGPDIPQMFGESRKPRVTGSQGQEKIVPLEAHGVKLMSLGFLLEAEQPAIMRGPLISGILKQFLEQVHWGELDYLVVDMPPGTGDAQLSLAQTVTLDGAVMVTTPQEVSTGDVRRAIRMFERVNTPVLGIVENMAGMACPHCGGHIDVFGNGGGVRLAEQMGIRLLGSVPLDPAVRIAGDEGAPTALSAPDSAAGHAFGDIADRVVDAILAAEPARA